MVGSTYGQCKLVCSLIIQVFRRRTENNYTISRHNSRLTQAGSRVFRKNGNVGGLGGGGGGGEAEVNELEMVQIPRNNGYNRSVPVKAGFALAIAKVTLEPRLSVSLLVSSSSNLKSSTTYINTLCHHSAYKMIKRHIFVFFLMNIFGDL